jgi:hypothetical protein
MLDFNYIYNVKIRMQLFFAFHNTTFRIAFNLVFFLILN